MPKAKLDTERQGLNKWEMHKALQSGIVEHTDAKMFHIPETRFGTPEQLSDMLQSCPSVFIKPVSAWGGSGITRVHRIDLSRAMDRSKLTGRVPAGGTGRTGHTAAGHTATGSPMYDWHKQGEQRVRLSSIQQVVERFRQGYTGQAAIVQAGAPLRTLNGRPFDIRVLMQRDSQEKWVYSGAVGRVGGAGSVVSNIALSHGEVMDVKELCRRLECKRKTAQSLLANLEKTGHAIAQVVEKYRDFFDIGIDIGLSPDNDLWIIEVNTDDALGGPSHKLFAKLPDKALYDEIQKRHRATRDRRAQMLLRELQALF